MEEQNEESRQEEPQGRSQARGPKKESDIRAMIFNQGRFFYCNCYPTSEHLAVPEDVSHASKVMLKILQARLQQYMNHELPDVQAVLEKTEEPEIKLPTFAASWKKQESSRKTSISALLTTPKPLTVWITINCGKF